MRSREPDDAGSPGRRRRTALLALVLLDWHAVRMIMALGCCVILPGLGWARRMRIRDLGDSIALTVVLSLCITVVVATAMVLSDHWSTAGGAVALLVVGAAGFVPVSRLEKILPVPARGPRRALVSVGDGDEDWIDWYADARRRAEARDADADQQRWWDWEATR